MDCAPRQQRTSRGNLQRGIVLLETAAQTFLGNADVYNTLAGAYLQAGQPKRAVAIYASLDLRHAGRAQYHAAIGAALAAHDMKQAESWLQAALDLYKDDPAILKMAAQYEQARGDAGRAAAYYRAALDAMGPQSPAEIFSHPANPAGDTGDPGRGNLPARELMRLLAPSNPTAQTTDDPDRGKFRREAEVTWRDGPRAKVTTLGEFDSAGADGRDQTSSSLLRDDATAQVRSYSAQGQAPYGVSSRGSRSAPSPQYVQYRSPASRSSLQNRGEANHETPLLGDSPAKENQQEGGVEYRPREGQSFLESQRYANDIIPAPASLGDFTGAEDPQDAVPSTSGPIMRTSLELPSRRAFIETRDQEDSERSSPRPRTGRGRNRVPADSVTDSGPAEKLQDAVKDMETQTRGEGQLPLIEDRELEDRREGSSSRKDSGDNFSNLPLSAGAGSNQVASSVLPPLTGAVVANQAPMTPREQIQQQLAVLEGASSSWTGGTSSLDYRSGQPGYDRLAMFSGQAEASGMLGPGVRTTFIVKPVLLDAGQATGTDTIRQGTLPAHLVRLTSNPPRALQASSNCRLPTLEPASVPRRAAFSSKLHRRSVHPSRVGTFQRWISRETRSSIPNSHLRGCAMKAA